MIRFDILILAMAVLQDPVQEPEQASGTVAAAPEQLNAAPADGITRWLLRYQYHPDQTLRYESRQQMVLDASVGDRRKVDKSDVKQVRRFTVTKIDDDGSAHLAMQFEKVWMQKQVDDQPPVEFDASMKPADVPDTFRHVAHSLKGNAAKFWLSPQGLSCYPAAKGSVTQANQPETDSGEGSQGSEVRTAAYDSSQPEAKDPGSFLMLLPDAPIAPGETWKETISVKVRAGENLTPTISILRSYRLDSVEGDIATISFRSSVVTQVRSTAIKSQLIQATPSGSFRFDLKRGLMLSREFLYQESVIGAFGPESLLSSSGTHTETLLE